MPRHDPHYRLEEPFRHADDLGRVARSANAVKSRTSQNRTETSASTPRDLALAEDVLGHVPVEVAPERLAQLLALEQPGRHPVDPVGQLTSSSLVVTGTARRSAPRAPRPFPAPPR